MKNILITFLILFSQNCFPQNMTQSSNWKRIPLPLNSTQKLFFWSADSGFAYGNENEAKLIRTYDGGKTWQTLFDITQLTGSQIYKCPIHIRNKNEVGIVYCDKDSFIHFLKTYDSGNSWEKHMSQNKINTQCYDMIYNADTVAIASSSIKADINGALFYSIQYSINNFENMLSEIRYGCYINFRQLDKNNIFILNANTRLQKDGSIINNAYSSFRFGYDLKNDTIDMTSKNWNDWFSDGSVSYFPNYNNIDEGFLVSGNRQLKNYPINYLATDSFYYSAGSLRSIENVYENFCSRGGYYGFCIDKNKIAIARSNAIFVANGSSFNGGYLSFNSNIDIVTCIYFGSTNNGYIGTSGNYLFKTTNGIDLVDGFKSEEIKFQFKVYPNPTLDNNFRIEFANDGEYKFTISNSLGQILLSGICNNNDIIDLGSLPKGIFYINANDNFHRYSSQKIVIR